MKAIFIISFFLSLVIIVCLFLVLLFRKFQKHSFYDARCGALRNDEFDVKQKYFFRRIVKEKIHRHVSRKRFFFELRKNYINVKHDVDPPFDVQL
jgi:hypothetical protein